MGSQWYEVDLTVFFEVLDEVGLRLELPRQLGGVHVADGALLGLGDFVGLHLVLIWKLSMIIQPYSSP